MNCVWRVLQEKTISCACLAKSGLKHIFHWNAQWKMLLKSSFNCFLDKSPTWTTEKMDVPSAKGFVIDDKFLLRLLIYIKKKRDPKMEPWETSSIIGTHVEDRPLSNTCWYLLLRKLTINFNRGPDIPVDLILQINPSCQTPSNILDISKNAPLISRVE